MKVHLNPEPHYHQRKRTLFNMHLVMCERSFAKNAVEYVECLGGMAVDEEESFVLEYSRQ